MTELMVLATLAAVAFVAVYALVIRAGRRADRAAATRQAELEALARMHGRLRR
jgi:hypothetical protein